jgi:osmotically-inducible protein OsmY/sporulation protein YlmC with PRC-barrel domain
MFGHSENEQIQNYRSEEDTRTEIWNKLWSQDTIRMLDIYNIDVEVHNDEVTLNGHVSKESHQQLIQNLVEEICGVSAIRNNLVSDRDLTIQVAHALANDPRTRPYIIRVGAFHGWIHLQGDVPSSEACAAVEEVAGRTKEARGVITLPRIAGEPSGQIRRGLQPMIGAKVYASDGRAGRVSQVIVNPRNRLVTHVVVERRSLRSGQLVKDEYVLSAETIVRSNGNSIFLKFPSCEISEFPVFEGEEYPTAPNLWHPPFPYKAGSVRWSRQNTRIPGISQTNVPKQAA